MFIKIRPLGVALFHADRQTENRSDMEKLIVAIRSFANALRKDNSIPDNNYLKCF